MLAEVSQPMGFPNLSPQPPNQSHSPQQPMNMHPQGFLQSQMMFPPQQPPQSQRFNPNAAAFCNPPFASSSQAAFVQQFQFMQQQPPQPIQQMNNMGAPNEANTDIIDLDAPQNLFEDQNISENLSGQLRMCGINSNDPGEMLSMENMSTDSMYKKYLG